LILAVACGKKDSQGNGGNGEKKSNESPSKKISIVLDWTPNTNHTGLFVAKELGYFKEEGLENVEIVQPPEGSTTALIGAGGAQFGISFQDTLAKSFSSDNPVPVTAVAAIISHNTSGIISLKEKGIDSPKKLEGHKYATWDDEIEKAILKKIITDDGGDFKKVKMIPNTVTDVVTALKTDIDAVWVYYAWDGIATELAGLQTNFLNFADYGKELDYYSPVIIANNDYLKKNPEEANYYFDDGWIRKEVSYQITVLDLDNDDIKEIIFSAYDPKDFGVALHSFVWKEINGEYKYIGNIEGQTYMYFDADRQSVVVPIGSQGLYSEYRIENNKIVEFSENKKKSSNTTQITSNYSIYENNNYNYSLEYPNKNFKIISETNNGVHLESYDSKLL